MRKIFSFFVAFLLSATSFAAVSYELNGGVTNDYGWMSKNDMFQACMADCGITDFPSLEEIKATNDPFPLIASRLMNNHVTTIMGMEKWDWLEAYIMQVQNADANAIALVEGTSSAAWRYAVDAFFLESQRTAWPKSADFSVAGTPEAFIPSWKHAFANPTEPTAEFVLNAPYKKGKTFGGWYATADFSGEKVVKIDATTTGTLYAKWVEYIPTVVEVRALADDTVTKVSGVVNFISGKNIYIQDATAGILVYTLETPSCKVGDKIVAQGVKVIYGGAPEVKNAVIESAEAGELYDIVAYENLTALVADSLEHNFFATRVTIPGVTIVEYGSYNNPTVTVQDALGNKALCYKMVLDPVVFPIGSKVTVTAVAGWYNGFQFVGDAAGISLLPANITVTSNNTTMGTVSGSGVYDIGENAVLTAIPKGGYHFSHWDDGNTQNPRVVKVTKDKTYTAYFEKNTYNITKQYDAQKGSISGSTSGKYLDVISLTAIPNTGYHFSQWHDGVTDNPRTFVITQDTTFSAEFAPNQYTITTVSSNTQRGTTQGDTTVNYLEYITISATANYGYHFVRWNDGNSENPRQVKVTKDMTYTATFDKNIYNISLRSNNGTIESVTHAAYLDNVTMMAVADYGYHFAQWSDGVTDNPRTFVITQDTTFSAEFAQSFSGQCGDNLYWVYANDTLTITGTGAMYDERPWGLLVDKIQKIALPTGITHIGNDAFQDCIGLRDIDLPYTLETIGDYSFNGCRKLITINCYPLLPPIAELTSFSNYSAILYAPCDNLEEYERDMVFGQFKDFECIGSESISTNGTVVTPGSTDVTITWPTDENADTYTIVIMKGDVIFCRLIFNKEGQLLNISFAPGRDGQNRALYAAQTANGLRFTVTGLEEKTKYGYDVSAKDDEDNTISSYTGEFTTQSTTAVDNITTNNASIQKVIRDGQLIILRNGVDYNAMGQKM